MSNSYRKYIILIAIISAILGIIVASVLFHSFQLLTRISGICRK